MVTRHGTRAKEGPQMPPSFYKALASAQALVDAKMAERVLVQGGSVYVEGATCAGCGTDAGGRPMLVDEPNAGNPWCPGCGGRSLVALDVEDGLNFDNGLVRMQGSRVIHLIAPPMGESPLCMPNALVGRMQPVTGETAEAGATCKRCLAASSGTVFGTYERTIPARGAETS